jgi:hypothetical protein
MMLRFIDNQGVLMNKTLTIALLTSLYSTHVMAGACDASSPEEVATRYGVDVTSVSEEVTYERKTTSECMWTFEDADGHEISITYRTFDKTQKITNPDFFKNNQQHLVENGNKVGKIELSYRFEPFENTEHGILSNEFGSKYTRTLQYIWIEGEERRLGVTYNTSVNDEGHVAKPTEADIRKAVSIFTD